MTTLKAVSCHLKSNVIHKCSSCGHCLVMQVVGSLIAERPPSRPLRQPRPQARGSYTKEIPSGNLPQLPKLLPTRVAQITL